MPWDRVLGAMKRERRQYTPDEVQRGLEAMRGERYPEPMTAPIPGGVAAKEDVDSWLTENVVDPLAARGWPNLGAVLATPPSIVADMVIPQQGSDLAMPGVAKLGRMANKVGKKAATRQARVSETYQKLYDEKRALDDELASATEPVRNAEYEIEWDLLGTPDWYQRKKLRNAREKALNQIDRKHPGASQTIREAKSMSRDVDRFAEDWRNEAMGDSRRILSVDDRLGEVERQIGAETKRLLAPADEAQEQLAMRRLRTLHEKKARLSRQLLKMDGQ